MDVSMVNALVVIELADLYLELSNTHLITLERMISLKDVSNLNGGLERGAEMKEGANNYVAVQALEYLMTDHQNHIELDLSSEFKESIANISLVATNLEDNSIYDLYNYRMKFTNNNTGADIDQKIKMLEGFAKNLTIRELKIEYCAQLLRNYLLTPYLYTNKIIELSDYIKEFIK